MLGSGAVILVAKALVADLANQSQRSRVYGFMADSESAGFVVGPLIGGCRCRIGTGSLFYNGRRQCCRGHFSTDKPRTTSGPIIKACIDP